MKQDDFCVSTSWKNAAKIARAPRPRYRPRCAPTPATRDRHRIGRSDYGLGLRSRMRFAAHVTGPDTTGNHASMLSLRSSLCRLALLASVLAGSSLPAGATDEAASVAEPAQFRVEAGKLKLSWVDAEPTAALVAHYDGDAALARNARVLVRDEINGALDFLSPLADWRDVSLDDGDKRAREFMSPEAGAAARIFTGPLAEWAQQFIPQFRDDVLKWRPTRLAIPSDDEPGGEKTLDPLPDMLTEATGGLLGKFFANEIVDYGASTGRPVAVHFFRPVPVERVAIAGMDFLSRTARTDADRALFPRWARERQTAAAELACATRGLQLAWNDDIAVQRLATVTRARGWWNGYATAPTSNPRAVHWLSFADDGRTAVVHVPHLSYLVFEPGADSPETIRHTVRELLRPNEADEVLRALDWHTAGVASRELPAAQLHLYHVVHSQSGRTIVDLFSLASWLGTPNESGKKDYYPALPVRADWLEMRLARVRERNLIALASPATTTEDRLVPSKSRGRRDADRGGIEIWVSPRDQPPPAPRGAAPAPPARFKAWLDQLRLSVEAGASIDGTDRTEWIARAKSQDAIALGKLALEVRHDERWSAQLDWQPLAEAARKSDLLPSSLSVLHEEAPERAVAGAAFQLERDGLRAARRRALPPRFAGDVRERWNDFSAQLARVQDRRAAAAPTETEIGLGFATGARSAENPWDARDYRDWRVRLTGWARGEDGSDADAWAVAEFAAQWRVPRGGWSYYGSVDVRGVLGRARADALPWVGGNEGVRGVRLYRAPARFRAVWRNELWTPTWFVARDTGAAQSWFRTAYETLKPALFVDTAWAGGVRETAPTRPWFVSPGAGVRLILGPVHLSLDYAYGFTRPSELGGHRLVLGATARY